MTNNSEYCKLLILTTAVASPYSRSLYGNNILFKILKYPTSNSLSLTVNNHLCQILLLTTTYVLVVSRQVSK